MLARWTRISLTLLSLFFLASPLIASRDYPQPRPHNDLFGKIQYIYPQKKDRIYQVARRYNVGYYELIEANPDMPRHSRLSTTEEITIPSEFIIPNVKREGIIINLPELRIYFFNKANDTIKTLPIAIGRFNWKTPAMQTSIVRKYKDPVWTVPKSIKAASAAKGIYLPDVVKAGPKNPLGAYALRLGRWSYLIHGTSAPNTIGKRASSGCMRTFPESIKSLYYAVPVGTPVQIVNEPIKMGWRNQILYMEVHEPLRETAKTRPEMTEEARTLIDKMTQNRPIHIDWQKVRNTLDEQSGMPVAISTKVPYQLGDYEQVKPVTMAYDRF
jgi:L,D-transpeptidase ErfK/SrfK